MDPYLLTLVVNNNNNLIILKYILRIIILFRVYVIGKKRPFYMRKLLDEHVTYDCQ